MPQSPESPPPPPGRPFHAPRPPRPAFFHPSTHRHGKPCCQRVLTRRPRSTRPPHERTCERACETGFSPGDQRHWRTGMARRGLSEGSGRLGVPQRWAVQFHPRPIKFIVMGVEKPRPRRLPDPARPPTRELCRVERIGFRALTPGACGADAADRRPPRAHVRARPRA